MRSAEFMPEELQTCLLTAAEDAYREIEAEPEWLHGPNTAHRAPVCGMASHYILKNLTSLGHRVQHEVRSGQGINQHSYLSFKFNEGEIIADATWQQFLPREKIKEDLPRVLLGTREEVIEQARTFGVDERWIVLWEEQPIKFVLGTSNYI